jgi:hypothetical protein
MCITGFWHHSPAAGEGVVNAPMSRATLKRPYWTWSRDSSVRRSIVCLDCLQARITRPTLAAASCSTSTSRPATPAPRRRSTWPPLVRASEPHAPARLDKCCACACAHPTAAVGACGLTLPASLLPRRGVRALQPKPVQLREGKALILSPKSKTSTSVSAAPRVARACMRAC